MKKRAISLLLAAVLLLAFAVPAFAAPPVTNDPQASAYLNSYSIAMWHDSSTHEITASVSVDATHTVSKVGVTMIRFDKKEYNSDGSYYWSTVETQYALFNPTSHYSYNSASFAGDFSFIGEGGGTQYRAVAYVIAQDSTGSDSGNISSFVVTC